jgi:sugar phosphate isomerase/epimerase
MKLSCSTLACPEWSLDEIIPRFREYGYQAIEFRGLGKELAVYNLPEFTTHAARTAERIRQGGLDISDFASSACMFDAEPAGRARHLEEVRRYVEVCRAFGAGVIRVFGGALKGTPPDQAIPIARDALWRMSDLAGDDVALAVETHDDWMDSDLLERAIASAGRANVGALWDLHHPYLFVGESPATTFAHIGPATISAHVKDSRRLADGQFEYCLPGQGDVPLAEMIQLLAAGGYTGFLTLEWEKRWIPALAEPEIALPAYAKYLAGILAAL